MPLALCEGLALVAAAIGNVFFLRPLILMKAILLDIEGTTTPISFVHDTLFPYAKARMGGFILDNLSDLKFEVEQLLEEHAVEANYKSELRPESANSITEYLKYLIDQDRKSTPLKTIQGMIWKQGYESGELVSPVFQDVPIAMKRWKSADKVIAIYSSGSTLAQKLLFRYTDSGDLTQYIANYFDTNIGPKREPSSFSSISEQVGCDPASMLFISDTPAELDAAVTAGMQAALSVRPGNLPLNENLEHSILRNFDTVS